MSFYIGLHPDTRLDLVEPSFRTQRTLKRKRHRQSFDYQCLVFDFGELSYSVFPSQVEPEGVEPPFSPCTGNHFVFLFSISDWSQIWNRLLSSLSCHAICFIFLNVFMLVPVILQTLASDMPFFSKRSSSAYCSFICSSVL